METPDGIAVRTMWLTNTPVMHMSLLPDERALLGHVFAGISLDYIGGTKDIGDLTHQVRQLLTERTDAEIDRIIIATRVFAGKLHHQCGERLTDNQLRLKTAGFITRDNLQWRIAPRHRRPVLQQLLSGESYIVTDNNRRPTSEPIWMIRALQHLILHAS